MARHVIFYFSGTGNSLKAALSVAKALEDADKGGVFGSADSAGGAGAAGGSAAGSEAAGVRIVCMGPDTPFRFDGACDTVGFVFPCYFGGVPNRVLEFVRSVDFSGQKDAYRYAILTYGGGIFSAPSLFAMATAAQGAPLDYAVSVKAFSTYVVLYKMSKKVSEKTAALKQSLDEAITDILARRTVSIRKPNALLSLYSKSFSDIAGSDANFIVGDSCIGCGQCARLCPVSNIEAAEGGRPVWLHHCEQCLACLHLCPQEAIEYGSKTRGRGRYKHPEITVQMLLAYNHNQAPDKNNRWYDMS
jgi:formate hydrogenlyase subunit 6/NADH:ubiquinone oxidoreductase subunit I